MSIKYRDMRQMSSKFNVQSLKLFSMPPMPETAVELVETESKAEKIDIRHKIKNIKLRNRQLQSANWRTI